MNKREIKRILAGVGVAGLVTGAGLIGSSCTSPANAAWSGDKKGAGSVQDSSSWSGQKTGAGSTADTQTDAQTTPPAAAKPGGSWSGQPHGAGSTADETTDAQTTPPAAAKPGGSWSGSKQ